MPFCKGSRDQNGESCNANTKKLRRTVKCKKCGENKKTRALWSLKEAKDDGKIHDLESLQKIHTRSQLRLALWAIHLKSLRWRSVW